MGSAVLDPALRAAIDQVASGLDAVFAAGVAAHDGGDAITVIRDLEAQGRRMAAAQAGLVASGGSTTRRSAEPSGSARSPTRPS